MDAATSRTMAPAAMLLILLALPVSHARGQPLGSHTSTPEFWLDAVDPVVQRDRKISAPADYMALFGPPLLWPTFASRLSTFEISTQLVVKGTTEEQQTVLNGLRARHIRLAGQFGVEERDDNPACGGPFEGMGGPANAAGVAKNLHDIGGELDYLDMDEPVTWGRESPRTSALARSLSLRRRRLRRWPPIASSSPG